MFRVSASVRFDHILLTTFDSLLIASFALRDGATDATGEEGCCLDFGPLVWLDLFFVVS